MWMIGRGTTLSFAHSGIPEQDNTFLILLREPGFRLDGELLLLRQKNDNDSHSEKNELRSSHWFLRGQPEKETGKERCDSVAVPQL